MKRVLSLLLLGWFLVACGQTEDVAPVAAPDTVSPSATAGLVFPIERTAERMERGRYLVEGVAHCFECHSESDYTTDGQPRPGKKGGGQPFPEEAFSWLIAPNISPDVETGAGSWTDEQFARAIRSGIGNDGRTLFPMMPYMAFSKLSDEDLASIIVYVRSIPPVKNALPKTEIPEPFKAMMPPAPLPWVAHVPAPDLSTPQKRGEYLVNTVANCAGCHSPFDPSTGQPVQGLVLTGGLLMHGPWGLVTSYNITPHASGLAAYDENIFVQTIRTGKFGGARQLNPIMPWGYFRNMTDDDLKAIFAYLKTVPPVQHRIDNQQPVAKCKICDQEHHGGALND